MTGATCRVDSAGVVASRSFLPRQPRAQRRFRVGMACRSATPVKCASFPKTYCDSRSLCDATALAMSVDVTMPTNLPFSVTKTR